MVIGTDPEEFLLCTRVRTGLKREFAFALKAQAEISGSLGRTRGRRLQNVGYSEGIKNSTNKKLKSSGSKKVTNVAKNNEHELVKDQIWGVLERESINHISSCNDALINREAAMGDLRLLNDKGELIVEHELDCISEDEAKSDVVDMTSDEEPKNHLIKSLSMEELNDDSMRTICKEELKCNLGMFVNDGKPKFRFVNSAIKSEEMYDSTIPISVDEPKGDHVNLENSEMFSSNIAMIKDEVNNHVFEESSTEASVLVDNIVKMEDNLEDMLLLAPALKSKVIPVESPLVKNDIDNIKSVDGDGCNSSPVSSSLISVPLKKNDVFPNAFLAANVNQSKKNYLRKGVSKLRELLDTGILEGLHVKYVRGSKVRAPNETGLSGVIKGSGILCSCGMCKGTRVVTPNQFELHAGSSNKRPPEYIYIENGNTLRDLLNACKDVPLDDLEAHLQEAIASSSMSNACVTFNRKGSISKAVNDNSSARRGPHIVLKDSQVNPLITDTTDWSMNSVLSSKSVSMTVSSKSSSVRSKIHGKLTRKDLRLHRLVFEEDVLPDGTEVGYYARGQKLLGGYKTGLHIFCDCCNSKVSPSQFEAHAGWASRRKPYLHIYTSNGVSLHELSLSLSRGQKVATNVNDDLCTICWDGGDLLCCDGCPRAFHRDCITLSSNPGDTWFCKYCESLFEKEKDVEKNQNALAAGRVAGVDSIEQITKRCIRIVKNPGAEFGGCALCRCHDFSKVEFGSRTVILCDQCEKEFHVGCLREHDMDDLKELPNGQWFCCAPCNTIHSTLQNLVDSGEHELSDRLLNVIKTKQKERNLEFSESLDIKWRLLNGKMASDDTKPFLSKAVSIFHQQFDPIIDPQTNRDFIPNMVYGRNLWDHEFGNMFCAILTVNSCVVSTGIFRIFGQEVAELPLVATSRDCVGLGYFQCLFCCIEDFLGSLNIKNFVVPAAEEAESIWTNKFGFKKLSPEQLKIYRREYSVMSFTGTSMLQKRIPDPTTQ